MSSCVVEGSAIRALYSSVSAKGVHYTGLPMISSTSNGGSSL
jgi:hypothetical protein